MSYNILIGTPAYGGQVHTDYVKSILPLPSVGVNFNTVFIGNQSLITRARNEIFSMFVSEQAKAFSHLLFYYTFLTWLQRLVHHLIYPRKSKESAENQ